MDILRAMAVFRRVADRGSLSAASADMGLARGAASAIVSQLEERLGVQLLERTTRRLRLTEDGSRYLERAAGILDDIAALEEEVGAAEREPRGHLRIQVPPGLGRLVLAPELPRFFAAYPKIELELLSRNGVPDFVGGQVDAAIVLGELPVRDLAVRKVGLVPCLTVAAPSYLAEFGTPARPEDLARHACISVFSTLTSAPVRWRFRVGGEEQAMDVRGPARFESAEAAVVAATRGLGIVQMASYLLFEAVRKGHLVPVLAACQPSPLAMRIVHPRNRYKPKKLKVFEDFVVELDRQTRRDWGVRSV
jgi:LysR family transcriptional regulator for bpeEF and oprC